MGLQLVWSNMSGESSTPKPGAGGVTTNERLWAAGLLDEFEKAARARDREGMIELLRRVDLGDQAAWIADTLLARP